MVALNIQSYFDSMFKIFNFTGNQKCVGSGCTRINGNLKILLLILVSIAIGAVAYITYKYVSELIRYNRIIVNWFFSQERVIPLFKNIVTKMKGAKEREGC